MKTYDSVIVGGGTAGLTAALYLRRAGKSVMLLEREGFGGQILYAHKVENYPGIQSLSGADFIDSLLTQVEKAGADYSLEDALSAEKSADGFLIKTDSGGYRSRTLIIAAGLTRKKLGVKREDELLGRGVSYCATCDGAFFKGGTVAVVGGGNAALSEALHLSELAREVYLIHRRGAFRAEDANIKRVLAKANISPVYHSVVEELHITGEDLSAVTVKNVQTGETSRLKTDCLFVSVGKSPHNAAFSNLIALDDEGYIVAGEDTLTSCPGVFAAGDCRKKRVRQLTTAAADGTAAAIAAAEYL